MVFAVPHGTRLNTFLHFWFEMALSVMAKTRMCGATISGAPRCRHWAALSTLEAAAVFHAARLLRYAQKQPSFAFFTRQAFPQYMKTSASPVVSSFEPPNHRLSALRLCASLSGHGLDARQMLADAGISPHLARQTLCRVSNQQMVAFLKASKTILDDEYYGLAERALKPGTIHYMFEMGLRCETLQALIAHCQRFAALLMEDISVELATQLGTAILSLRLRRPELDPDHLLIDQMLLYWHRVMGWAVGYQIPLNRLDVTFDEPPHSGRLCHWVCKTWVPGQAVSALHFDSRYLSLPVVRTPLEWQAHALQANGLPGLPEDEQAWSQRLRALLQSELKQLRLPSSLNDASGLLGVGARTLRRHLDKEGTSYQQVLDQLLHDAAIEKLHVQRLSVADVAEQLGFAEPRSFSRAFKRWTGVSPTRYSV